MEPPGIIEMSPFEIFLSVFIKFIPSKAVFSLPEVKIVSKPKSVKVFRSWKGLMKC